MCKHSQGRLCASEHGLVFLRLDCRNWKCSDCAKKMRQHYLDAFDDCTGLRDTIYYGEVSSRVWTNSTYRKAWKTGADYIRVNLGGKVVFFSDQELPGSTAISVSSARERWREITEGISAKCIRSSKCWRITAEDAWTRTVGKYKVVAKLSANLFKKTVEAVNLRIKTLYDGGLNLIQLGSRTVEETKDIFTSAIRLYASGNDLYFLTLKFNTDRDNDLREEVNCDGHRIQRQRPQKESSFDQDYDDEMWSSSNILTC